MINVKNVVKTFDGFRALDDLSLQVPAGSVYGLVGPNGSGKSTIIRHITGVYRPDSGEITVAGQPVYENPSPGNKAGGISTLEEKSLGCTQKSGSSIVRDVLLYGERLKAKGLNLLSAPGNDLVASTALAAAGCQIVLFTTGRGTPFGTFVPTAKISTNSTLAARKPLWIDFNAGAILEGTSAEEVDAAFIDFVTRVASGEPVNNEKSGYSEIAIFKSGVTL
jgi:altronate hydrolase